MEPECVQPDCGPPERGRPKRLLVAWFRFSLNGSIGRFINVARTLAPFGHEVGWLALSGDRTTDWPDFPGPVLTLDEARAQRWDAVMVPGAGGPADRERLYELAQLRDPAFGLRVQHILNDTHRYENFALANYALEPQLVVFNNSHWSPPDYRKLAAEAFHTVAGAVDGDVFYPAPYKTFPARPPRFAIGAFGLKEPGLLLDTLDRLPADHELHLYGPIPGEVRARVAAQEAAGRVVTHGKLYGADLAALYRQLDVVVAVDRHAGWCNPAAEAMACGVPTVVSRAGTVDFVEPGVNAVRVDDISDDESTADGIAGAVRSLTSSPDLARRLATAAAATMRRFGWTGYAQRLLAVLDAPRIGAYFRLPELGLYGKWEPATRLHGLEPLLDACDGASILDLGAAEGIIDYELAQRGARAIHGFELAEDRVAFADRLLAATPLPERVVRQADLGDWDRFERSHGDVLRDAYDIVLFLGLYHHLPESTRRESLDRALARSHDWFAIRTPEPFMRREGLVPAIEERGFRLVAEETADEGGNLGWLGIFRHGATGGSERSEEKATA